MANRGGCNRLLSRLGSGIILVFGLLFSIDVDLADAQPNYPERTVRLIVGFGAGTPPDLVARVIAERLSKIWGKPVIVENVAGASGNLAGEQVARSEPDGHTLLVAANAGIVVNPSLFRTMSFDPLRDLAPITILYAYPNILVASKELGVHNVQQLVALARSKPGQLLYGSAGAGTTTHLASEMLRSMAKIDISHVPYRGGTHIMSDLIANRIQFYFGPTTSTLAQARHGTVTALAVTSASRFSMAPDLPTMKEAGFPEFEINVWWGLMAPAMTPAPIIAKLHQEVVGILAENDIRKRFASLSVEPAGNTPEEFSSIIRAEMPIWSRVIKDTGIRID